MFGRTQKYFPLGRSIVAGHATKKACQRNRAARHFPKKRGSISAQEPLSTAESARAAAQAECGTLRGGARSCG